MALRGSMSFVFQALLVVGVCSRYFLENFAGSSLIVLDGLIALVAVGLIVDSFVALCRKSRGRHSISAIAVIVLLVVTGPLISSPFQLVSARIRLSQNKARYLELIRRAEGGQTPRGFYLTQDTPMKRYSFLWGGVADSWFGVVHDETRTFPENSERDFGPDNPKVLHLDGPWYYVVY